MPDKRRTQYQAGRKCGKAAKLKLIEALPEPACKYGYAETQLEEIFGNELAGFNKWIVGQTMSICTGEEYDHKERRYIPTECMVTGPHGSIVYQHDVVRYLLGLPVVD